MSSATPDLAIDSDVTHWTVHGVTSSRSEALRALASGGQLLVALHGFGANERDLVPLAGLLPEELVIAFPRAPLPVYGGMGGYAWFPLQLDNLLCFSEAARHTAKATVDSVWEWIGQLRAAVKRLVPGAGDVTVSLLGFSQGGAIATSLLRHHPDSFARVITLSGFVLPETAPGDEVLRAQRPPLFWGRDRADPVVPAELADTVAQWAPDHTTLTQRSYTGMGHGITAEELADVAAFFAA